MKIMARKPETHQQLLFVTIIITTTIIILSSPKISATKVNDDVVKLLLSFKSSLNDPLHVLSDWSEPNSDNLCQWPGLSCDNSSRLTSVDLAAKNISGGISPAIFQLPGIETLDLSNNQLTGELPRGIFGNYHLNNSLRYLNLSNNNLTGPVPRGSVWSLETLDLSNNMLSGNIPADIGQFWSLKFLDLGGNVLSGSVPVSVSNISGLEFLTLASNQLFGEIPRELCLVLSLKLIYLGYNNFSGEIPREIGELRNLRHLDLVYNNLSGRIPESIGNLTELRYVFLYQNRLSGPVPGSVFELRNLISLDLSDNSLSGEIPEAVGELRRLEILHLFSNRFSGKIPASLASLPRLQVLQLWSNELSGEIPGDLGERNNLTVLDLSTNRLVGEVPPGLCGSGQLFKLILFSNSLGGKIPERLSRCRSLRRVRLQNNRFSGELQPDFTKLPLVYFLDISGNELSGKIGESSWDMASLQMLNLGRNKFSGKLPESFGGSDKIENLVLSENRFSGKIPAKLFRNSSKLMQLDLSHNELYGQIPGEWSKLERLVSLDLSHNRLSGSIPESLAEMPVLGQLDLSSNELSGEIPSQLGRAESLVHVNVSHNHLRGSLPSTAAFLAINATAVKGNAALCGGADPSSTGLPPCRYDGRATSGKNHRPTWLLVVACFLAAATVAVAAVFLAATLLRRTNKAEFFEVKRVENGRDEVWELQLFDSKLSKSVTIEDIILCAKQGNNNLFILEEILVNNNDVNYSMPLISVKFGKILKHRNLARLMGLCRRSDNDHQKKGYYNYYFVYEYVERGKILSEVMRSLSWERRRKVAAGVARALRFLHAGRSSSVPVGRWSPADILVDGDGEPRLKLRVPGMVFSGPKGFDSNAYVAPEARNKGPITEKSDIYGFGLILIELLTGKGPTDAEFGVHETFIEWARYCYSDCHLDTWIDPSIRGHVSTSQNNEIVETMNLALHCTAGDPTARPCADDLCKILNSVMRSTSTSCVSGLKVTSPQL